MRSRAASFCRICLAFRAARSRRLLPPAAFRRRSFVDCCCARSGDSVGLGGLGAVHSLSVNGDRRWIPVRERNCAGRLCAQRSAPSKFTLRPLTQRRRRTRAERVTMPSRRSVQKSKQQTPPAARPVQSQRQSVCTILAHGNSKERRTIVGYNNECSVEDRTARSHLPGDRTGDSRSRFSGLVILLRQYIVSNAEEIE